MKNKWPLILLLLLLGLCGYSFLYLFEPYEETEDLGWDKKALRNPYLAAEQFLTRAGIPVTSSNNFDQLNSLPEQGMVFISNASQTLTARRVDSIIDWMEQGGHLVIAAPVQDKDEQDMLLSRFNVSNTPIESEDETESDSTDSTDKPPLLSKQLEDINKNLQEKTGTGKQDPADAEADGEETIAEAEITRLKFTGDDFRVRINFSTDAGLSHPSLYKQEEDEDDEEQQPLYWSGTEYGVHFMQFEVGDGLLSILSDNSIWQSDRIHLLDHAFLLYLLSNSNSEVVLLYGANMPSIFYYIWKYGSEMVMALGLWLLAWLLYRSRRFGSIRGVAQVAHRSMAEHISASGEYLWRDGQAAQLIEPLRDDIRNRLQRHYPHFIQLSDEQQLTLIQEHCELPAERVASALGRNIDSDETGFTTIMIDLQKIRNTL